MTVSRTKNVLMNGPNTLQPPSTRTNRTSRSNSVCSHRSPNHSRTNSFSRTIPLNGDMLRRNSHATTLGGIRKDSIGCDTNHRESINLILNDDKLTLAQEARGCVFDGSICPLHNYVHRDSSENTPTSSDTEELHHRFHGNGSHHHDHGHAHDFASKNINIQAAVIHVIGDFIQSVGVFVSAVIIKYYVSANHLPFRAHQLIQFCRFSSAKCKNSRSTVHRCVLRHRDDDYVHDYERFNCNYIGIGAEEHQYRATDQRFAMHRWRSFCAQFERLESHCRPQSDECAHHHG